jgi:hypothetical protein
LATNGTLVAIFLLLLPKMTTDQAFDPLEPAGPDEGGNVL